MWGFSMEKIIGGFVSEARSGEGWTQRPVDPNCEFLGVAGGRKKEYRWRGGSGGTEEHMLPGSGLREESKSKISKPLSFFTGDCKVLSKRR